MFLRKQWVFIIFCCLFFSLGFLTANFHTKSFEERYRVLLSSNVYQGYVIEKYDNTFILKNFSNGYRIIASYYKELDVTPGDYVKFKGNVNEKNNYNKKMMNSKNIDAYITISSSEIEKLERFNIIVIPIRIKYKIINSLLSIDKIGGSFLCGLLTGYIKDISLEDLNNFQNLGISHILAISGFNIGIVYMFVNIITRKLSARLRYFVVIITCFFYTVIGGFEASIFRAFLIISIVTFAKMIRRPYDVVNGITLAGLIMLILNSFYLYNLGFLLSFTATYGIILLKDDINDVVSKKIKYFSSEISVSLGAFLMTLPIIIWNKGFFNPLSILINILIGPLVALLTVAGFISSIIYLLLGLNYVFFPTCFLGFIFMNFIKFIAKFDFNVYIGQTNKIFIILYYLFLFINFNYINFSRMKIKKLYLNFIFVFFIIASVIPIQNKLLIHFINVGQGDSIFIETPDHKSILIDTGPEYKEYSAAREKVIPYIKRRGYKTIDLLIITHFHKDHCGGLKDVFTQMNVKNSISFNNDYPGDYLFTEVSKGDRIKIGDIVLKILYPNKNEKIDNDKNETCLIIELIYKDFNMLLTGDAEKDDLEGLEGNYDLYKVPHHGSVGSLNEKMIEQSHIETAIISVGKNNFGHPSDKVINTLKMNNIDVFRTDINGNIMVITDGINKKLIFQK
ncbi:DNA internalization-related competence protein ComEC/Rec2 [Fervidicella metallireducens]|nr:DNA internalization-related competence protein ComEC/Rec2 [Fervidicella metallireducens]